MKNAWKSAGAMAVGVAVTSLAIAGTASAAPTIRLTAGSKTVTDSHSARWAPAGGRLDGRRVTILRTPAGTASPRVYNRVALGSSRLRMRVPSKGRYAVTIYTIDPVFRPRPASVFDVYVAKRRVLKGARVLRGENGLSAPLQNSFETNVKGRRLNVTFKLRRGTLAIAAVTVTRLSTRSARNLKPVLTDDFNGPAGAAPNASLWTRRTGFGYGPQGLKELQTYTDRPENASLNGKGELVLTARPGPFLDGMGNPVFTNPAGETGSFTSGRVDNLTNLTVERARLQVRLRVPAGRGLWPAVFLIGAPPAVWPVGGEIDVIEMIGQEPNIAHGFVHGEDKTPGRLVTQNEAKYVHRESLALKSHTYELRTYPDSAEFFLDGRRYGSVAKADINRRADWPLDNPFRLALTLAVGGWPGAPDGSTPFPATMSIDYVRLFA